MQHEWIWSPFTHHQNECLIRISQSCCVSVFQDYPSVPSADPLMTLTIYVPFFLEHTFCMFQLFIHQGQIEEQLYIKNLQILLRSTDPVTFPQPSTLSLSASHSHVCLREETNHSRQNNSTMSCSSLTLIHIHPLSLSIIYLIAYLLIASLYMAGMYVCARLYLCVYAGSFPSAWECEKCFQSLWR